MPLRGKLHSPGNSRYLFSCFVTTDTASVHLASPISRKRVYASEFSTRVSPRSEASQSLRCVERKLWTNWRQLGNIPVLYRQNTVSTSLLPKTKWKSGTIVVPFENEIFPSCSLDPLVQPLSFYDFFPPPRASCKERLETHFSLTILTTSGW